MKAIVLQLNLLEIITLLIAIVSLTLNIYQYLIWRKDQTDKYRPVANELIALFNDIKLKRNFAYGVKQSIFDPNIPNKDVNTLLWDYIRFIDTMISALHGFHEYVVGILVTLNPDDPQGVRTFRSLDYGLTAFEKEMKALDDKRTLDQYRDAQTPSSSVADK